MSIRLAVIAGPEVYELLRQGGLVSRGRYVVDTPFGQAQPVYEVEVSSRSYLLLPRQGEGGAPPVPSKINYRANIYALKELGAEAIVAWSGPAALTRDLPAGTFCLPADIIDFTCQRVRTFFERGRGGFVVPGEVFCPELRRFLGEALRGVGLEAAEGGVYLCTEGPRMESAAEVRLFTSWGATLVGMTLSPEVFLARELAICYAALCVVTGHGEGIAERRRAEGVLYRGLADDGDPTPVDAAFQRFPQVIESLLAVLEVSPERWTCRCRSLSERDPSLRRGDWHDWLRGQDGRDDSALF